MSLSDFVGGMFFTIVGVLFQVFIDKFKNAQKFINYVSMAALSIGMFWLGLEIGTMGSFESLNGRKSVGLSVPMSNWKVNGETIGSSILGDDSRSGEFELSSVQAENFFTIPEKQIIYSWDSPGAFPELNRVPLRGIQSVILISPLETKYEIERVFCHYTVRYAGVSYISIEQYIPFNQRTLMLWDFNGKISPSDIGMSGEDLISLESGATLLQKKGVSFTYYARRLSELWQWQSLVGNNYDPNTVEKITLTCNVSATQDYRGGNVGDRFTFRGKFNFGDVFVNPYDQKK